MLWYTPSPVQYLCVLNDDIVERVAADHGGIAHGRHDWARIVAVRVGLEVLGASVQISHAHVGGPVCLLLALSLKMPLYLLRGQLALEEVVHVDSGMGYLVALLGGVQCV